MSSTLLPRPPQLYSPAASGGLAGLRTLAAGGDGDTGRECALACLDHLVVDALASLPACLRYLAEVELSPDVFRFCAIPQARVPRAAAHAT